MVSVRRAHVQDNDRNRAAQLSRERLFQLLPEFSCRFRAATAVRRSQRALMAVPEDQEYPIAAASRVAKVPGNQLVLDSGPQISAARFLDLDWNGVGSMDRDNVGTFLFCMGPFRFKHNIVQFQQWPEMR